jgi:hypothetical protein
MFDDTKDDMETRYADVIKDKPTVFGKIMGLHCYPLEESPIPGNIEIDITLEGGEILEASVPSSMFRTLQERAFEPALFVVNPIKPKHYECQAILFSAKTQKYAA